MATFNSANGSYLSGNKSLFETMTLAMPNGSIISNTNPLPVSIGGANISFSGSNVNVTFPLTQNVSFSNQSVYITTNVVAQVNNLPLTQNVSFSNQTVYVTNGNINVDNFPLTQNVSFSNQSVSIYNSNNTPINNTNPISTQVVSNTTNYVYTQAAPTWSTDALYKLRISSTLNQNWFVPVVDDDITFRWSQQLVGSQSSSTFLANTSEIQISSGNTATGSAIRQTFNKYKIVPGTSHTLYTTINFEANTTESGVTRRSGLFDQNNGIYWEQGYGVGAGSANTLAVVVRRTQANGLITEDRIYANNFNTDKLDGTGPSGMNIFTSGLNKYYTFWFDFIGGRTGRIRFGLGSPIGPQICHVQSYSASPITTNFINDNSLPMRREIFNNSVQTTAPTFNMTGISFQSEAPVSYNPSPASAYNINGYVPSTSLAAMMTIGLRAGAPYTGSDITPGLFSIVDMNNQGKNASPGTYFYQVIYNANVNGTYAYAGNSSVSNTNFGRSSKMWTWSNTSTVSGGLVLVSGFTESGVGSQIFDGIPETFNLGSDLNGNPATLTIAIQQLAAGGSAANVVCSWNVLEQL